MDYKYVYVKNADGTYTFLGYLLTDKSKIENSDDSVEYLTIDL